MLFFSPVGKIHDGRTPPVKSRIVLPLLGLILFTLSASAPPSRSLAKPATAIAASPRSGAAAPESQVERGRSLWRKWPSAASVIRRATRMATPTTPARCRALPSGSCPCGRTRTGPSAPRLWLDFPGTRKSKARKSSSRRSDRWSSAASADAPIPPETRRRGRHHRVPENCSRRLLAAIGEWTRSTSERSSNVAAIARI